MKTNSIEQILQELKIVPVDYAAAKKQAKVLDDLLGYECDPIEDVLFEANHETLFSSPRQFWYGLDLQTLQTPYSEIVEMVQHLKPQPEELWLDLGAGYGRMGIVLASLCSQIKFVGYEYVQKRVDEGNRIFKKWNFFFARMKQADLAAPDFELEPADLYFLYDFGSKDDVYKIIKKLQDLALKKPIRVVARGRGVRNWILMDFPWLYDINPPEHFANWTVFRS